MKFRPGQRVRVNYQTEYAKTIYGNVIGKEGTFLRYGGATCKECNCIFRLDGDSREWEADDAHLSPLTDPGFESFMERIQKPLTKPEWEAA